MKKVAEPSPVSAACEEVLTAARAWGVPEDQPEGAFIWQLVGLSKLLDERMVAFGETLKRAQEVPADQISQAVERGVRLGVTRVAQAPAPARAARRCPWLVAVACVGLLGGAAVGFVAGSAPPWLTLAKAPDGVRWLAMVATYNDLSVAASWCDDRQHLSSQSGGDVCYVPLWIKRPAAKGD